MALFPAPWILFRPRISPMGDLIKKGVLRSPQTREEIKADDGFKVHC